MPEFPAELANRAHALGMGVLVGWGPTAQRHQRRTALPDAVRPRHPVGFHSDGGDITVINPWLNFSTMITGRNLAGQAILGDQTLTRQETLRLATAANKWFIWEDDLGSIEAGNHADLAVLDRDYFTACLRRVQAQASQPCAVVKARGQAGKPPISLGRGEGDGEPVTLSGNEAIGGRPSA